MGVLRGIQDVKVIMPIALVSYWLLNLPVGYLLGFTLGMGPTGLYLGFAVGCRRPPCCSSAASAAASGNSVRAIEIFFVSLRKLCLRWIPKTA